MRQNFVAGSLGSSCIAKKRNVTGFNEVQHRRQSSRVCGENWKYLFIFGAGPGPYDDPKGRVFVSCSSSAAEVSVFGFQIWLILFSLLLYQGQRIERKYRKFRIENKLGLFQ
jgi:hypothetical protein